MFKAFYEKGFSKKEIENCLNTTEKNNYMKNNYILFLSEFSNDIDFTLIPKIRNIYNKGYEFPIWIKKNILKPDLLKYSELFFSKDFSKNIIDIRKLAIQREPVNITMTRYYNQSELKNIFGWEYGYYQTFWNKNKILAPNIAIYCKTPVYKESSPDSFSNNYLGDVHILNVIGLAFDSKSQPDYKYCFEILSGENSKQFIYNYYDYVFNVIYEVAIRKKFKNILMSAFGANNFAIVYPGGPTNFQKEIWIPLFKKHLYNNKINTIVMGMSGLLKKFADDNGLKQPGNGYFPDLLYFIDKETTLIINAWDPFSFVGNGNFKDNSLDGFIGRYTACSMLCWPIFNKHLKFTELNFGINKITSPLKTVGTWSIVIPNQGTFPLREYQKDMLNILLSKKQDGVWDYNVNDVKATLIKQGQTLGFKDQFGHSKYFVQN